MTEDLLAAERSSGNTLEAPVTDGYRVLTSKGWKGHGSVHDPAFASDANLDTSRVIIERLRESEYVVIELETNYPTLTSHHTPATSS